MSGDAQCDAIRELLPELALGIADGEDRSRALEHAATCADCRRELESLSAVADELLELAPAEEPPAGFEVRVLGALPGSRSARRTVRRPFAFAAVALATAALTAGITVRALEGDRSLADHYRSVLAEAHGSSFSAARLRDAAGAEGGTVFLYRGSPSWIVITVIRPDARSVDRAEIETGDGRRLPLAPFGLDGGTWGGSVPVDLDAVSRVRLLDADGRVVLEASPPAYGD
jgi:putative zinc finger protein